jgi:hypothetical protein
MHTLISKEGILLSQLCKTLIAARTERKQQHDCLKRSGSAPNEPTRSTSVTIGETSLQVIVSCARDALATIRAAFLQDLTLVSVVIRLIETEALPQAARWHRRDLAPALEAAWNAVLRALQTMADAHIDRCREDVDDNTGMLPRKLERSKSLN